jgi:hypothetical protein
MKSLHFVSPPVLMTSEAEHPLKSSAAIAVVASATFFIVCLPGIGVVQPVTA